MRISDWSSDVCSSDLSEICARHFRDREVVWAAAFAPNDGGVSYLVKRLTETLDESLKAHQIGERLSEQARTLAGLLRRFHHADDDAARQEKDRAMAADRKSTRLNSSH